MRSLLRSLGTVLVVALLAAAPAPAAGARAHDIRGERSFYLPEAVQGNSTTIGPGGIPWFGLATTGGSGASIAHVRSGRLSIEYRHATDEYASTGSLQFDAEGNLWFTHLGERQATIVRLSPSGELTEYRLPRRARAISLTITLAGDVWFTWSGFGGAARIGWLTPAGGRTEIPLASASDPSSVIVGPDGAIWFGESGDIGRVTTDGVIQLFPLGEGVQPHELAVGPDGAIWFTENGEPGPHRHLLARIGRMTTNGQVTQFQIPFGNESEAIAADPRGAIWFSTEEGEISSISTSGTIGPRGCATSHCGTFVNGIALAPGGALWFSAGVKFCKLCGGGTDLIAEHEGTLVGKIPAGALTPAAP